MFSKKLILLALGAVFFICAATIQAKDWKQCEARLILTNTLNQMLTYNVVWIDHEIVELKGRAIPRCGGEVEPGGIHKMSVEFRLCSGRHAVMWYSRSNADKEIKRIIRFTVTPNVEAIVITPDKVFMKTDNSWKPTELRSS